MAEGAIRVYNPKTRQMMWVPSDDIDTETPRAKALEGQPFNHDYDAVREKQDFDRTQLHHYEETKSNMAKRKEAMKEATKGVWESVKKLPTNPLPTGPNSPQAQLLQNAVGAVGPRMEAMLANPALKAQAGERNVIKLAMAGLSGLSGSQTGSFGDLYMRALPPVQFEGPQVKLDDKGMRIEKGTYDLARPVSSALGMTTMAAATAGLGKIYNKITRRGADVTAADDAFVRGETKKVHEAIVGARHEVQDAYNQVYYMVDDNIVPLDQIKTALTKSGVGADDLDDFLRAMDIDPANPNSASIGVLRSARNKIIAEDINPSSFRKPAMLQNVKGMQKQLMHVEDNIKKVILDNVDDTTRADILALDPKYKEIMRKGGSVIRRIYDPVAEEYGSTMRNIQSSGQQKLRKLLTDLNKYDSDIGDAMLTMQKWVGRKARAKALKRVIGGAAVLKGAKDYLGFGKGEGSGIGDIHAGT